MAAVLLSGGVVFAAPHKLRVDDPVLANSLAAQGAKVIGEYGAFTVLTADDSLLAGVNTNHVQVADDWNVIRLNAQELDTSTPQVKALRKPRGAFAGRQLHLVQFAAPVKPEWFAELKQHGAQIVSYIPENAYLIYGDAPSLARMQRWATNSAFVQWDGEYSRDLKVHPNARITNTAGEVRSYSIQLIADANANTSTLALIDRLKGLSAARKEVSGIAPYRNIIVSLPSDQLDTVAAQPDVVSILPYRAPKERDERQDQILAGNLTNSAPSGPGYLAWLASKGFTQAQFDASGFVVDVADAGIDNGTTNSAGMPLPGHFGLYRLGDTNQPSRVAYLQFGGPPNPGGTLAGCDGHGAINAHIIGNYDGITNGFQHVDKEGYSYGVGVCPYVELGSSVIFDNDNPTNDFIVLDFTNMVDNAYENQARIINNSWGASQAGLYDSTAQTYDFLVREAKPNTPGSEMVIVFAAGNDGPCNPDDVRGEFGIDSPGSAKNVITVGASENVRSLSTTNGGNDQFGNDGCGEADTNADNANNVTCFSSQGPCTDGRKKPDLVAPGIHVTGGVPQMYPPPDPEGLGSNIDCFNGTNVCGLMGGGFVDDTNNFFPLGQQFYTVSSGTSHSTPAVSGGCALLRQYFINQNLPVPSPAMTKAFLMNSARFMTGTLDGGSGTGMANLWSDLQGMGEMNLGMAFDGESRFMRDQVQSDMFTATGQITAFGGLVVDTNHPFRVTIAWSDAPGSTTGAAYNNMLNLAVTVGGNTYLGNVFKGQYSMTGGTPDKRDNVASVFLPAGVSGNFVVTVTAANINSAAVPGAASPFSQDFALVVYNGTATNGPVYHGLAASYTGLFYESTGPELGKAGSVTLKTTKSRGYSGELRFGVTNFSFSGAFNVLGQATNSLKSGGVQVLGLALNANPTNSDVITGTVTDGSTYTANLVAEQEVFNAKTNPATFLGKYTLTLPGSVGRGFPQGNGYATLSVNSAGDIKLAGSLADGTQILQSPVATVGDAWPFFSSLYGGKGIIIGWMQFTNSGVEGNLEWIKAAIPKANFYPLGFDLPVVATGSAYNLATPLNGINSDMVVILSGGNLSESITNLVSVNGTKITNLSTNKLTMKVNTSNGALSGSVVNPLTAKSIPFNGVFLQNPGEGLGYFLGTNQSGPFSFFLAD